MFIKASLSLVFSRLNGPDILSLSSYVRAPVPSSSLWPFAGLAPVCPCLSCTGEPSTGPNTSGVLSRGEGWPPLTCWQYSAWCSPGSFWASAVTAHWWLMVSLVSTRTPRTFSAELLSSWLAQPVLVSGAAPPRGQNLALPSVELHEVPVSSFFQPVEQDNTLVYQPLLSVLYLYFTSFHAYIYILYIILVNRYLFSAPDVCPCFVAPNTLWMMYHEKYLLCKLSFVFASFFVYIYINISTYICMYANIWRSVHRTWTQHSTCSWRGLPRWHYIYPVFLPTLSKALCVAPRKLPTVSKRVIPHDSDLTGTRQFSFWHLSIDELTSLRTRSSAVAFPFTLLGFGSDHSYLILDVQASKVWL